MSLINQMLQDLDARKVAHGSASGLPNDVRPLPRSAPSRLPYVVGAVLLLLVLAAFAVFYSGVFSAKLTPQFPTSQQSAKSVPPPVLDAEPAPATEAAAVPPAAPPSEPVPPQPTVSDDELQALDLSLRMADFVDLTAERKSEDKSAQVSKAPISNKPASKTEGSELRKPQISESGKPESVELPKQEKGQPALPGVEAPASHPLIEKTDAQGTPHERADGEYRKAIALVNQGRVDDALAGLRNALRLEPLHQTGRQLLVRLLLEAKRSEEAEQAL